MARVVKVRTADMTGRVKEGSLRVGSREIRAADSFSFTLLDHDDGMTFWPARDDYVAITEDDGLTLEVAGKVRIARRIPILGVSGRRHELHCQGWRALMYEVLITASISWPAGTADSKMLKDLLDLYYAQIGTGITHRIFTRRSSMPAMSFGGGTKYLGEAIDEIAAEAFDADWQPTPDKVIHYNDPAVAPPFHLTDDAPNGTTMRSYAELTEGQDITQPVVRVFVQGGGGASAEVTDWHAWGLYDQRRRDEPGAPAERFYAQVDESDNTLTTVEQCNQRGLAIIAKERGAVVAEGRRHLKALTYEPGLRPGMKVKVSSTKLAKPLAQRYLRRGPRRVPLATSRPASHLGAFLLQRVTPSDRGADEMQYHLELGHRRPTIPEVIG